MKTINKLRVILMVGTSMLLLSCQGFLHVDPTNVLSVNSHENVRALLGSHIKMIKDGNQRILSGSTIPFVLDNWHLIAQFYADDLQMETYLNNWMGRNNRGDYHKAIDWQHPDVHENLWRHFYGNIGFYNMVIEQAGKFPGKDEAETNQVVMEAKVLRAFSFFRLVQLFSPYHNNELGLPLNTDPDAVGSFDKRRQTQTENYAFIIKELEEVLNAKTEPSPTYNLFFDKNIVNALLAQVYLFKGDSGAKAEGDYTKAAEYARAALKGSGITSKKLHRMPGANPSYGYTKENGFAVVTFFYLNQRLMTNVYGVPKWGLKQYATESLYDLFSDNDLRKKIFFDKERAITKGQCDYNGYFYQYDFFTAAELQLIIAESLARNGDNGGAEAALRELTQNRYEGYQLPAGKTVLQAVLDERRKEFCFEQEYRWLDLIRLQPTFSRKVKNEEGEEVTYTIEKDDYRFCMPIPKDAELSNNNIEQNPGWGTF